MVNAVAVDAGGGGDAAYTKFGSDIETDLQKIHDAIQEVIDYVNDKWDDSWLSGWLKYVSPADYAAAEYASHKLQEAFDALWDKLDEVVPKVWEQVDRLFATPDSLMDLSRAYQASAGKLKPDAIFVPRIKRYLQDGWGGDAFDSYSGAADEQTGAITAVAGALDSASQLCADGAKQIYDTWHLLVQYVLDQASAILDAIKVGTDAGQWVTLDAGPAIKLIGDLAINALKFADDLAKFWTDNQTTGVAAWGVLNDGNLGLARGNHWPNISGYDAGEMTDKGAWQHV